MSRIITDLKNITRNFRNEIWVLFGAFLFAAIGDLKYGGVEGAEASLVGVVLSGVSHLFFTVFLIMVLIGLLFRSFASPRVRTLFENYPHNSPGPKAKPKEKKK